MYQEVVSTVVRFLFSPGIRVIQQVQGAGYASQRDRGAGNERENTKGVPYMSNGFRVNYSLMCGTQV